MRIVPDIARERQERASDPTASAFVSANAGSGKTFVLVNRVVRLLLSGVQPEKILCVTFTKAAAANMAERVFTRLGQWVTLEDEALEREIRGAGVPNPDAKTRARARELFACALETPGGLKVQTIHALCTRLLQQFPFEAQVPARFAVMDDRDQQDMMERASLKVLLQAAVEPNSAKGRALTTAMTSAADSTFKDVIREATLSRDKFIAWIKAAGSIDAAMTQLSQRLNVGADDTRDAVISEIVDGPHMPRAEWKRIAEQMRLGTKTDCDAADNLTAAFTLTGEAQFEAYLKLFFTGTMEPRKRLVTAALGKKAPQLPDLFEHEQVRVIDLRNRLLGIAIRDRTQALLIIGSAVAENYAREKQARGLLDYDDLIDHTVAMLDRVSSSWIHYKLDQGVDHVLIDEAQDTSPRQWRIIAHLISEFTAGEGAREGRARTVFAVGDEKQSIFSFQGADPREFDSQRRSLKSRFDKAGLQFDPVAFTTSFRTGAAILHSVDKVFEDEDVFASIHARENGAPIHQALDDAGPSLIDLWPPEERDLRAEDGESWVAPLDAIAESSREARLAMRVRDEIRDLIATKVQTGPINSRRALRYGDILILVRSRGRIFDSVIQTLKHADIPVAGADRLKLTDHIAIIDLMHLADALLLPHDDLALAVALKSPIFGLDDDDLLAIAPGRTGSLRDAFADHAADSPRLAAACAQLERCEARFRLDTPFGFYAWLLGGEGARKRILQRLGGEANDAIDEFLELALGFERKGPATLQGFMAWLRASDTDVKRDMEISRDEVRVMTVHGAKGLEAPVVFMIDTTASPAKSARMKLIHLAAQTHEDAAGLLVWAGSKADDPSCVAEARASMLRDIEDEYRRLLYVAMTRAADRLIIGGMIVGNARDVAEGTWYDLAAKGLQRSDLYREDITTSSGATTRFSRADDVMPARTPEKQVIEAAPIDYPNWLTVKVAADTRRIAYLRPSDPVEDDAHGSHGHDPELRARSRQRGILVHRLLQSLPDLDEGLRLAAAERYLKRHAADQNEGARTELAQSVLALIDDPQFAQVFAQGSRAEVSISGQIKARNGTTLVIAGQIDRLVVTPTEVLIVDFKTNAEPPAGVEQVAQAYIRQLALYRIVLMRAHPGKNVRAALLWTETPTLMELPTHALDAEQAANL